jgi:hypothetical protein
MSMGAAHTETKQLSVRRNVNRKIFLFSLLIGLTATVLAALVYLALLYPALRRCQQAHQHAFEEISCDGEKCDTHAFTTDWKSAGADYIIDTETRFFIAVPAPTDESPATFGPLDYSDTTFIKRFRQPEWYETPDGEVWRLYSRDARIDDAQLEIIVGFAKTAPWKMADTDQPKISLVDATLQKEADNLAASVPHARASRGTRVDGFEIVDTSNQKVFDWGSWLPIFLPKDVRFPKSGVQLHAEKGDLYIVKTDTAGRLLAVSLVLIGSIFGVSIVAIATFLTSSVIAYLLSQRFLRAYFALMIVQVPNLEQALRIGEGQTVEFKRGLSDDPARMRNAEDELLKSIAAFANTNDGVIFIGVDDAGRINGLDLDFKQKDRLEQKIRQLVRNRIRPTPLVQVSFEDARGLLVTTITVARGEATVYMMGGVIYIRDGSSDVQAQPEDLKRLIAAYAY